MGRPLMNFVANIRDNIQERRAERQGYGNCHSTQSHFEGCRTQVEGCQPNNFRAKIAGGVPAQSVPAQSMGGARATVCENGVCRPADMAASATASSATTITPSAATKNYPDTKGQYGVKLGEGVYARIEGGKILATIDVSTAPSDGKFDYFFKEGTRSSRGSFDLGIVRAGSSGVVFDKTGADKLNARAQSTVDEIKLTIPDGKGGTREINISKASILKAEAAAEKQAEEARKASAQAGSDTVRQIADKAVADVIKQAREASGEATAGSSTVPPTKPQPEVAKKEEYNPEISASARELERLLQVNSGIYNSPTDPDFEPKVDALLKLHPTLKDRVDLIEAVGTAKLGEQLHEATAFKSVFDKIGAPLNTTVDPNRLQKLKTSVELLNAEFHKYTEGYDTTKISQAFKVIESLPKEAESLAAVYWSKIRNDGSYVAAETYETAKTALKKAIEVKPETQPEKAPEAPATPTPVPEYDPKVARYATEAKAVLASELGWNPLYNNQVDQQLATKLDGILAKFSSQQERAELIDSIGSAELGKLAHELPKAQGESVIAKFLAPLGEERIKTLTSAVDTLTAEYNKSGNIFASDFDKAQIKAAFGSIASLGDGAESFAKLVWYKKGNDKAILFSNDYDEMKKALEAALGAE